MKAAQLPADLHIQADLCQHKDTTICSNRLCNSTWLWRGCARIGASEVLRAAALRVTDLEALCTALQSLQRVLDGSAGGKIKAVVERLGLVGGITAFATAPAVAFKGNPEAPAFASDAASFLSTFYKHALPLPFSAPLLKRSDAATPLKPLSGDWILPCLYPSAVH